MCVYTYITPSTLLQHRHTQWGDVAFGHRLFRNVADDYYR